MTFPPYLLIPLACGVTYVLGMLCLKRANELGVGVWRTTVLANWASALVFLPWWLHAGWAPVAWSLYWQPAVCGLLFLAGQILIFLAITRGDVSVTTPVMGVKVILVALFSSLLLTQEVPLRWWIGAALSTSAIGLLNVGGQATHRRVRETVLLTMASAVVYGLDDVLIQRWAPAWGGVNFVPPMFLWMGLFSFALLRFARGGLGGIPRPAWRWVLPGAGLNAVTNCGIVVAIGIWGNATVVNIVYSWRGLVSVVVIWLAGHWFANTERHAGRAVLLARLAGAAAMLAAIVLVLR
ncbi:MAG: EamA family transporter [Opitutaceae bacterium]|nr:EamA family transporter [Opitutaceae bacterium]